MAREDYGWPSAEVAAQAIKVGAEEKAELGRRWEVDRLQKEAAWAAQQLQLSHDKEEMEAELRGQAASVVRAAHQRWVEQQAALDEEQKKEFERYKAKVAKELLKEKTENHRLATLKERVQTRLDEEAGGLFRTVTFAHRVPVYPYTLAASTSMDGRGVIENDDSNPGRCSE